MTLPMAGVVVQIADFVNAANNCATWGGTVRWDSDVPSWKVTFNMACTDVGKTSTTFTGTMSGDL